MCGLAGRFHPTALPQAPAWAERAGALLAHRGPDGAGCFSDGQCELVHRRLALVDLSPAGRQPMANEDGTVQVVFNGEIYNHRHLRRYLEARGHVFRSTSDTEVLVHLYEEEGERLVDSLRGIFAFAIYDQRRCRIVLGRDRFGVKPLWYAPVNGQWVFASEIKAIAALPGFQPALDRQACFDFLGLGYVPEPASGFANVAAVPHGTTLTISGNGQRFRTYHRVAAHVSPTASLSGATDALAERLLNAVGTQAFADVPVAALLSGGIDSSLVVAAHRRVNGSPTTTFNARFPDPDHDETARAQAVAAHCGTTHHTIDAGDQSLSPDAITSLIRHFDQPFADTSFIPMHWVSTAVRDQGIICALSGDGGDEAFGGYARFWRANRLARLMQAPAWMRRTAGVAGGALAGTTRDFGRQVAKATHLAEIGMHDTSLLLAGLSAYLTEEQKAELVHPDAREGLRPGARLFDGYVPPAAPNLEEVSRRMTEKLFAVSLPSDMLRKVDMMSMKAGIEVRVPLLDEEVVSLGLTLPHRLKTDGYQGKLVPRSLARRWLPQSTARTAKRGFGIPLDVMVAKPFYTLLNDLLDGSGARTRPFVSGTLVDAWLADFAAARNTRHGGGISRGGLAQRVMTLLSLELWMRDYHLSW